MSAVLCHNIGYDDPIYQGKMIEKGVKKQSTSDLIHTIWLPLILAYNVRMLKVLLSDRLFQALLVLLIATISAWAYSIFIYPFGLLVLLSLTTARALHLHATQNARANPARTQ